MLITEELYDSSNICSIFFRELFNFYAKSDVSINEGLLFFSSFPFLVKKPNFNTLKSFLFYFAYRTHKFSSPMVKELLSQPFLKANIKDSDEYVEFCMYCFYKGLYYIERKNFFMASYLYCSAVEPGLSDENEDFVALNDFSLQMIRSLCFLKVLSCFDIKNILFKNKRIIDYENPLKDKIQYEDIDNCLDFLKNDNVSLSTFHAFIAGNKNLCSNYKLKGLKNEAEEMLFLKEIKENLKIYKKIKISKLAALANIPLDTLMKVMKKKCITGELNVKYDEENDTIEVFEVDPGMKENIKKMQDLYKDVLEANKTNFINSKDKQLSKLENEGNNQDIISFLKQGYINNDSDDE